MNLKTIVKLFGLGAALAVLALAAGNGGQAELASEATQPGDVRITLRWFNKADVDLYVTEPSGEVIGPPPGDGNPTPPPSGTGGRLTVDANRLCIFNVTDHPEETIYWPAGQAPKGRYKVQIDYFAECQREGTIQWQLIVLVDGRRMDGTAGCAASGSLAPGQRLVQVCEFTRVEAFTDPNGNIVGTPQNPVRPGQTLSAAVGGLPPSSLVKVEVRRATDGALLSEQQLLTDPAGQLVDTVFLWDPGFDDQGRFVGERLRGGLIATVRREDGTEERRISLVTDEKPPERLFYPSNDRGELRPGLAVGDKVYLSGKNFQANSSFPVRICRDRQVWREGFDFERCTGTPLIVELKWEAPGVDLDLEVEDPFGNKASKETPRTPIDGELSIDRWSGDVRSPASEVFTLLEAPAGTYKIKVRYHSGTGPAPFTVTVTLGDETKSFPRQLSAAGQETLVDEIPNRAPPLMAVVQADSTGEIRPTLIWASARAGDWDIIADLDRTGTFTARDLVWQQKLTGLVIARVVASAAALEGQAPAPLRMQLAADQNGTHKNIFKWDEKVYVGFNPPQRPEEIRIPLGVTVATVYIVRQGGAQSGKPLVDVSGQPKKITFRRGCMNAHPTLIDTPGPRKIPPGNYDVVVDLFNDSIYDQGIDFIDDGMEVGGPGYGFQVGLSPAQVQIDRAPPRQQTTVPIAGMQPRLVIRANKWIVLNATAPVTLEGDGSNPVISVEPGARLLIRSAVPSATITITGGSDGIKADGADKVEIYDVTITNNGPGWGILLSNVRTAVIDGDVTVQANRGGGINVNAGSAVTINDVFIFQNNGDGIRVENATATIQNNRIINNGGCGIRIGSGATVTPPKDQLPQHNQIQGNRPNICP